MHCVQGLGGSCSEPVLLCVVTPHAARPLIGLSGQSPALALCTGQQAADAGVRPPGVSVVGIQSADQGARPPGVSGVFWGFLSRFTVQRLSG